LSTLVVVGITCGGLAAAGGTARAAEAVTVTCPTVSATGVVTPAPAPDVDWIGCDLASANLAGADLAGAILKGADLSGANLSGTDLAGAFLTDVTSGGVTGSPAPTLPTNWTLQGGYLLGPDTNLAGVDLTSLNLAGLDLIGADLAGANLAGRQLSGTNLNEANLTGASINGAQLAGASVIGTHFGAINGTPASLPTNYVIVTVPAGNATPGNYLAGPEAYLDAVDFSGLDLSKVDLAGANLYVANLSGANLSGADLVSTFLEDTNLTGANLMSANATNANLSDANLASAILSGTSLTGAELNGVKSGSITGTPASLPLESELVLGYLVGYSADLEGADLAGADLASKYLGAANLSDANLSHADLSGTSFTGTSLAGANLTGADLAQAGFSGVDLSGANATNANFTLATFIHVTVSGLVMAGANFTNASILNWSGGGAGGGLLYTAAGTGTPKAVPSATHLVDGFFVGPYVNLRGVSLVGANLSKDDLASASITNADLASANLDDANLMNASLTGTNLTSANLDDTNLQGTDLDGDTTTGATTAGAFWWNTTCPDGSLSNEYVHGCFSPLDTTSPLVKITGVPVPNRGVYVLGHVPTPGCTTTDNGIVLRLARLTVTTVGARGAGAGVGRITVTCAGAVDLAGNAAAAVSVSYTNVYGMTGFLSLANGATFARSTRVITVHFRLTSSTGKAIAASTAKAFAAAHEVRITLAGPGIRASTNTCAWDAAQQYLACAIHVPAGVKAGSSQRYTVTATEDVSTAFQTIPGVGRALDPQIIHFR
ncbi:MAG TPA: pentapeptide repeat-containing protein, partial [Trebonia sp.]